jgi:hypothetical protein
MAGHWQRRLHVLCEDSSIFSPFPTPTPSSQEGDFRYNGSNVYLSPGALLAIPAAKAADVNVTTVPGAKIKQAMVDFGAYIVDDTADDSAAICMEAAVNSELRRDYNITLDAHPGQAFYNDLVAIFQALEIVINNGVSTLGGGGKPRLPPAPPICGL